MQRWIMSAPLFSIHFNRAIIAASLGARNARRQASACARRICRHTPCRNRGFTWHSPRSPTGFGMFMSHVPPYTLPELRLHSALVMLADRLRHVHVACAALHSAGIAASLGTCHARRQASACSCRMCRPTLCRNYGFTRHSPCPPTGFSMRMSHAQPYTLPESRLHSALATPADRLRHAHVAYVALLHASIAASLGARHTRRPALTRAPSAPRKTKSPAIRPGK